MLVINLAPAHISIQTSVFDKYSVCHTVSQCHTVCHSVTQCVTVSHSVCNTPHRTMAAMSACCHFHFGMLLERNLEQGLLFCHKYLLNLPISKNQSVELQPKMNCRHPPPYCQYLASKLKFLFIWTNACFPPLILFSSMPKKKDVNKNF